MNTPGAEGVPGRLVLLGHPLGHTLSPVFQNAALRAAGIPVKYEALDVPKSALARTLSDLHIAGAAGNVTIPYKQDVFDACDRLTTAARAVGAVNTFWTAVDGARVGDNTDVGGFAAATRLLVGDAPPRGTIALLGAGGAARAVMHAMEEWPDTRVRLSARTPERAAELLRRFRVTGEVTTSAAEAVEGAVLVVNATPLGLHTGDALPVPVEALSPDAAVFDLAYSAAETPFVRLARVRGHPAMDGLAMLVEQGALSFQRWFGVAPDRDVMWKSLGRAAMMT